MNNMVILILIAVVVVMFLVYNSQKSKKNNQLKNQFNKEHIHKQKSITAFLDPFIDKIDLNMTSSLFSHSDMRIKCIRAGIREPKKHKFFVFMRYFLILPFMVLGLILAKMMAYDDNMRLLIAGIGGSVLGFFFPVIRLDSVIKDRQIEINRVFPDFVDLVLVCVQAGMTAEQAYVRVSDDLKGFSMVMADEIKILSAESTYFLDGKVAYENFMYRTENFYVKTFCTVVLQSLQYGTALSEGLRALSVEIREAQMSDIERKAQALPSKLTVPMMLFTMPVLFVVICYPAAVQVMEKL